MRLCKHVQPCVTSPWIPLRPENMQRLEVMGQITVRWLGVSLVVFTKHSTAGIQSVALNSPTDALNGFEVMHIVALGLQRAFLKKHRFILDILHIRFAHISPGLERLFSSFQGFAMCSPWYITSKLLISPLRISQSFYHLYLTTICPSIFIIRVIMLGVNLLLDCW